jgi:ATP synthase protein I
MPTGFHVYSRGLPQPGASDPSMTDRPIQHNGRHALWDDAEDGASNTSFKSLSREEAAILRAQEPPVSPWRVIAVQAVVGVLAALIGWAVTGKSAVAWSMLYGAATVVVPGALMARGMTSKLSSMAPGASAVSFMLWEFVKIGVSLAMLVVAGKIVQPLVWPALLVAMVVCMKVYWVALLWRRRKA